MSFSSEEKYGVSKDIRSRVTGCRVPHVSVNIHCSQPHLECVSHVAGPPCDYVVSDAINNGELEDACLLTAIPETLHESGESYPNGDPSDFVISKRNIEKSLNQIQLQASTSSLIIRIPHLYLPLYSERNEIESWPYLTLECASFIHSRFQHLRTNSPSVERKHSNGNMWAHCIFFGIDHDSRSVGHSCPKRTIGELFHIPEEIQDSRYGLRCPFSELGLDCAITVPLLFDYTISSS